MINNDVGHSRYFLLNRQKTSLISFAEFHEHQLLCCLFWMPHCSSISAVVRHIMPNVLYHEMNWEHYVWFIWIFVIAFSNSYSHFFYHNKRMNISFYLYCRNYDDTWIGVFAIDFFTFISMDGAVVTYLPWEGGERSYDRCVMLITRTVSGSYQYKETNCSDFRRSLCSSYVDKGMLMISLIYIRLQRGVDRSQTTFSIRAAPRKKGP